jgi:hypothetical protein
MLRNLVERDSEYITPPLNPPLLQRIVSVVERSAVSSSGHSSAIDIGASILEFRGGIDFISNTVVGSRIQPNDLGIRQDVAASESVDVVDGVIDHIAIAGHHDDASEVLEYVGVEDCHQVHDGTVEGVSISNAVKILGDDWTEVDDGVHEVRCRTVGIDSSMDEIYRLESWYFRLTGSI